VISDKNFTTNNSAPLQDQGISVLVAILGARMHYAVPASLCKKGLLAHHYTDFYFSSTVLSDNVRQMLLKTPHRFLRRIAGRYDLNLPCSMVTSYPLFSFFYTICLRLARSKKEREFVFRKFWSLFASLVTKSDSFTGNMVYSVNGEALEIFQKAKLTGINCILEQTIAPYSQVTQLYNEEFDAFPFWQEFKKSNAHSLVVLREEKEWDLANKILAGSQFVVDGLVSCGVEKEKCKIVPYAVDIEKFSPAYQTVKSKKNPLNVLFIGSVDLRKGIQYLYKALKLLDPSRFHVKVAGGIAISAKAVEQLREVVELLGLVPRTEVAELYRWADVFVFPSICEGSALVTYEALASGLPVITTPNAGSVVKDQENGYIVPIRDYEALANRLNKLAEDRELITTMSLKAREYALNNLSWEHFADRLVKELVS
jgi:glycosyltransferase involved in cell wall biosynthesis